MDKNTSLFFIASNCSVKCSASIIIRFRLLLLRGRIYRDYHLFVQPIRAHSFWRLLCSDQVHSGKIYSFHCTNKAQIQTPIRSVWSASVATLTVLTSFLNSYWQIKENLSRNVHKISGYGAWHKPISGKFIQYIFEISISGAWTRPISGKLIHQLFLSTLSVFCNFGRVFQKSVCVTPRNFLNSIFRLNALFWMNFPEIGLAHAPKICQ